MYKSFQKLRNYAAHAVAAGALGVAGVVLALTPSDSHPVRASNSAGNYQIMSEDVPGVIIYTTGKGCNNDKNNYNQGEEVWVSGENYLPGSDVKILIIGQGNSSDPDTVVGGIIAVADDSGKFCEYIYTIK